MPPNDPMVTSLLAVACSAPTGVESPPCPGRGVTGLGHRVDS